MAMIVGNEKTFEYFSDFFPELRQCVVDEMDPIDRCRFTRCSKRSREEAKRSKNYIYRLGFFSLQGGTMNLVIHVEHGKGGDDCYTFVGYKMRFQELGGTKFKICQNSENQELWREELDDSKTFVQHVADYCKQLLKLYQNKIKSACFQGKEFNDIYFEIESMKNLKKLETNFYSHHGQLLSKLQNPLNSLEIHLCGKGESVAQCEQIYQVRDSVFIDDQKFSVEQVLQFTARYVYISMGNLTARDIASIIRAWKNGRIKTKSYVWHVDIFSSINMDIIRDLWRLLGQPHDESTEFASKIEIEHNIELGKKASLEYSWSYLSFSTIQPNEQED